MEAKIELENKDGQVFRSLELNFDYEISFDERWVSEMYIINKKGKRIDIKYNHSTRKWQVSQYFNDLIRNAIFEECEMSLLSDLTETV